MVNWGKAGACASMMEAATSTDAFPKGDGRGVKGVAGGICRGVEVDARKRSNSSLETGSKWSSPKVLFAFVPDGGAPVFSCASAEAQQSNSPTTIACNGTSALHRG